jgi:hypothetical protein
MAWLWHPAGCQGDGRSATRRRQGAGGRLVTRRSTARGSSSRRASGRDDATRSPCRWRSRASTYLSQLSAAASRERSGNRGLEVVRFDLEVDHLRLLGHPLGPDRRLVQGFALDVEVDTAVGIPKKAVPRREGRNRAARTRGGARGSERQAQRRRSRSRRRPIEWWSCSWQTVLPDQNPRSAAPFFTRMTGVQGQPMHMRR